MIDRIAFIKPINVGGYDLPSYVRTRDGNQIEIHDKGNFLWFTYKKNPGARTRVPMTNIAEIAETLEAEPEKKK